MRFVLLLALVGLVVGRSVWDERFYVNHDLHSQASLNHQSLEMDMVFVVTHTKTHHIISLDHTDEVTGLECSDSQVTVTLANPESAAQFVVHATNQERDGVIVTASPATGCELTLAFVGDHTLEGNVVTLTTSPATYEDIFEDAQIRLRHVPSPLPEDEEDGPVDVRAPAMREPLGWFHHLTHHIKSTFDHVKTDLHKVSHTVKKDVKKVVNVAKDVGKAAVDLGKLLVTGDMSLDKDARVLGLGWNYNFKSHGAKGPINLAKGHWDVHGITIQGSIECAECYTYVEADIHFVLNIHSYKVQLAQLYVHGSGGIKLDIEGDASAKWEHTGNIKVGHWAPLNHKVIMVGEVPFVLDCDISAAVGYDLTVEDKAHLSVIASYDDRVEEGIQYDHSKGFGRIHQFSSKPFGDAKYTNELSITAKVSPTVTIEFSVDKIGHATLNLLPWAQALITAQLLATLNDKTQVDSTFTCADEHVDKNEMQAVLQLDVTAGVSVTLGASVGLNFKKIHIADHNFGTMTLYHNHWQLYHKCWFVKKGIKLAERDEVGEMAVQPYLVHGLPKGYQEIPTYENLQVGMTWNSHKWSFNKKVDPLAIQRPHVIAIADQYDVPKGQPNKYMAMLSRSGPVPHPKGGEAPCWCVQIAQYDLVQEATLLKFSMAKDLNGSYADAWQQCECDNGQTMDLPFLETFEASLMTEKNTVSLLWKMTDGTNMVLSQYGRTCQARPSKDCNSDCEWNHDIDRCVEKENVSVPDMEASRIVDRPCIAIRDGKHFYSVDAAGQKCYHGAGVCNMGECVTPKGHHVIRPPKTGTVIVDCVCNPEHAAARVNGRPKCTLKSSSGYLSSFTDEATMADVEFDFGHEGFYLTRAMTMHSLDKQWDCSIRKVTDLGGL